MEETDPLSLQDNPKHEKNTIQQTTGFKGVCSY